MTIRHNTKFRRSLARMEFASTDDIRNVLLYCESFANLRVPGWVIRVIANTGIRSREFMALRISDVDSDRGSLTIDRPCETHLGARRLPLRPKTLEALLSLHQLNPQSEFALGDHPRTRFHQTIRTLDIVAPRLVRKRLRTYSLRLNFAYRLMSAGIPSGMVKYCLGRRVTGDPFGVLHLDQEQKLQVLRRNIERFMEEL